MPKGSTIIGVDLMPIKPIRGVITHTEDITTPQCRTLLKRDMGGRKVRRGVEAWRRGEARGGELVPDG